MLNMSPDRYLPAIRARLDAENNALQARSGREEVPPDWWASDRGAPLVSGLGYAARCAHTFVRVGESRGFQTDPTKPATWACAHADMLEQFFNFESPNVPFRLITTFSDTTISAGHSRYLERPELLEWHAVNVGIAHPKLKPIPIGVPDFYPGMAQFNPKVDLQIMDEKHGKSIHVSAMFKPDTNRTERDQCAAATGIRPDWHLPRVDYLRRLAQSMFTLSPAGTGLDCHRTWEALYQSCVPILRRSALTDSGLFHGLPVVILERWEDFNPAHFSLELHERMMRGFNPMDLTVERWLPELARPK